MRRCGRDCLSVVSRLKAVQDRQVNEAGLGKYATLQLANISNRDEASLS